MKIASWNVNSVRQRQDLILDWLKRHEPDVLMMQEIKCETTQFPAEIFQDAGYECAVVGQKSYNGVATLVRGDFEITTDHLPGFENPAARYVEVRTQGLTLGNLYLPNGNSGGEEGYATKLAFFDALACRAQNFLNSETDFVLAGDYNVCPTAEDYAPGALGPDDALVRPESRAAWRRLVWLGLTDALRAVHPTGTAYTFWDYQAGAWQRDCGLRIDHALLSPRVAERLIDAQPDKEERAMERPSDHVPLIVTLKDPAAAA
ncbi:exodeoxyribonuclease III [Acetobacter cerevisiae]|uniref:Exodeoxyribonuclease III n=1 Tax=Acetobacter cerevisiae TaxID=178900 RepID=A0A149UWD7_9PROT|nr:exodeoxyribonuclease III [Acetobacter cerevisiae]KXV72184.1 exodeoxyribonuclease III [Acetobacter cerevisiae]MCP1246279.1 exodeoxyribonuclease III [Acetobacter cerevisiae]MCP1255779.1 exodeoxyribonuclease III [Acetobacter cerevisiae]